MRTIKISSREWKTAGLKDSIQKIISNFGGLASKISEVGQFLSALMQGNNGEAMKKYVEIYSKYVDGSVKTAGSKRLIDGTTLAAILSFLVIAGGVLLALYSGDKNVELMHDVQKIRGKVIDLSFIQDATVNKIPRPYRADLETPQPFAPSPVVNKVPQPMSFSEFQKNENNL